MPPNDKVTLNATDIAPGTELPTTTHTYSNVELFQFSAVGWHAHRVHFDQAYTRDVEGHADLLVHGQLQAVHLVQWMQRHDDGTRTTTASAAVALPAGRT